MLKANHGISGAASALMDASRALLDTHADNGHGLHTLKVFEKEAGVSADLKLSEDAIATMAAAVDAFGRCCGDAMTKALMHQMAVLEPLNDHAYTLPVRCDPHHFNLLCNYAMIMTIVCLPAFGSIAQQIAAPARHYKRPSLCRGLRRLSQRVWMLLWCWSRCVGRRGSLMHPSNSCMRKRCLAACATVT